jgi:hypothetical protein
MTGAGGGEGGNGSTTQVEQATDCKAMQCLQPADGFEVKASASYPGDAAVQIDVN